MRAKFFAGCCLGGLLGILSACDADSLGRLKPGVSTSAEVIQVMGQPKLEWREADGTRYWEYPRTPEGMVNYRLVIGPDDRLREVQQLLTEANFAKVKPGMSREDIQLLLGQPAHQRYFSLKHETVWDWKTKREPGMDWYFNVHFNAEGLVTHTSTNFEPRG
ncbi:MAG TPA: outer membrane protein assembly factor BamE [Accumulibacter sp.]|nr:outer membrane protein assembly factor BamE [Accumulibacter sp.]HMW18567.1 outer membrane protein assembly factor BamE [Accumulibacter sp.]HMX22184.1 outer membrane protein assembly factor BamE [Accumulibacter sp.]HMY07208.1 outer membrane protein assembly factor BamE [Accumulibacter sp.]HNC17724.1 outer membrane protein assembly factor BamE [Accumulibacter sp.]